MMIFFSDFEYGPCEYVLCASPFLKKLLSIVDKDSIPFSAAPNSLTMLLKQVVCEILDDSLLYKYVYICMSPILKQFSNFSFVG